MALTLSLAAACQQNEPAASNVAAPSAPQAATASAPALTPEQLGTLGAQIRREPARGDELLAQHKLNRTTFEKAIRDVTENPEASRRYAEAYRKASA